MDPKGDVETLKPQPKGSSSVNVSENNELSLLLHKVILSLENFEKGPKIIFV